MTPHYERDGIQLWHGDALETLRELPDGAANMCVTSPPYWGLRDYGTATWEGGDTECDHKGPPMRTNNQASSRGTFHGGTTRADEPYRDVCGKCGAKRIDQQLGLEATPEAYVCRMVEVFREVRRVLADDGTLWVNIGDSYAGSWGNYSGGNRGDGSLPVTAWVGREQDRPAASRPQPGLKPKDLVGIPWALAKALRDPYYVGQMKAERDRVWLAAVIDSEGCISGFTHDRADGGGTRTGVNITITNTSANLLAEAHRIWPASQAQHENHGAGHLGGKPSWRWICNGNENRMMLLREIYPYLIAKRAQALLAYNLCAFMADAKRMGKTAEAPAIHEKRRLLARLISEANQGDGNVAIPDWCIEPPTMYEPGWYLRSDIIWSKLNPMPESVQDRPTKSHEYLFLLSKKATYFYNADAIREAAAYGFSAMKGKFAGSIGGTHDTRTVTPGDGGERNKRTVWTISTEAYPEAHFATFPTALVTPCVLAGCPEGGTVLEPFAGSGTTLQVAKQLGRRAIGIELNAEYLPLITDRLNRLPIPMPLFTAPETSEQAVML